MVNDPVIIRFPRWLELSGLPVYLAEQAKGPAAWLLFRKLVELDCERNARAGGSVDASLASLHAVTGLSPDQVRKTVKKLRKAGLVRCFLPDNDEEDGLFQIIAPVPTPVPWQDVRATHPDLGELDASAFRYATAPENAPPGGDEAPDDVMRAVVDLYLDNISMKLNAITAEELGLIARRYDLGLVRKVFARAKAKEVRTLGWVLREIRVEDRARRAVREAQGRE